MRKKTKPPESASASLRQRAEGIALGASARLPQDVEVPTPEQARQTLHELRVHQIELEMQNEELRRAQVELDASRARYFSLYDLAPVGYCTLSETGMIIEANLTAAELVGTERNALIQQPLTRFICAEHQDAFYLHRRKLCVTGDPQSCELQMVKKDGTTFWANLKTTCAPDEDGILLSRIMINDISERKQTDEDRLVLSKLESTGILAGGIAHDFNNLLTPLLLHLDIVASGNPPGGANLSTMRNIILTAQSLTKQLITFTRGEAPLRNPACLSKVIKDSVSVALMGSTVKGELSLPDDLDWVDMDEGQIGQVFRNLILNAREAMAQGGVVSLRAENITVNSGSIPALPPGAYVRVSVADRGHGIPAEVLPKIFDPYFSTKQRGAQKGMGLGLAICHSVIQKHRGSITVESTPGHGTTFHIYLPACRRSGPAQTLTAATAGAASPRCARVLVMDDEEIMRVALAAVLEARGYAVEVAWDGQSAIDLYAREKSGSHPFDLLILDLTIRGGMGGEETMRNLLNLDPAVKAVVMSGYSDHPVLLEYKRHGFKAAMEKTFDAEQLHELISQLIAKKNKP